jgi:hypothetical protein
MKQNVKKFEKTINNIIDDIITGTEAETLKKYPDLIDTLVKLGDPDDYDIGFLYDIKKCLRCALKFKYPEVKNINKLVFLYSNYCFVEHQILTFIEKTTGTSCSVDKARYVVRGLMKYFVTGEKISFEITDEKQYWIPIFWNIDEWLFFYDAIVDLYYGKPNKYLIILQDFLESLKYKNEKI